MQKKISILVFLIIIFIAKTNYASNEELLQSQTNDLNIDKFISESEKVIGNEIDLDEIFVKSLKGESSKNIIINAFGIILGKELKESVNMVISILLVIIIHGILKNISENLGNEQTGKIGYFIQIIFLITILMKIYSNILNIVTNFINQFVIPIIIIATVIGIISNISDEIHMNKIAKYMKTSIIWILCISLTIFTCLLSMESNLTKGVDQLTSKTTKTAVSTFVPVVGKILGDAVESVIGCSNIMKNAVGAIGMFVIILIGMTPLIRIGITMMFFYFAGGLAEMVSDKKIVYVLEQMGDSCKVLLASVATVIVMLIIGVTITMKVGIPT